MAGLVILVTGTRKKLLSSGTQIILQELDNLLYPLHKEYPLMVMHGDCPTGVDKYVGYHAGIQSQYLWPFPADWKKQGKGAGFARNIAMVSTAHTLKVFGHDVRVLAFPSQEHSPGTNHCIEYARKYQLNTKVVSLEPGIDHQIDVKPGLPSHR